MAISQEDILARIQQIQSAGGGDTAATRAQIAREAQQYGVTPEQIGAATGLLGTQVRQMAEEAGQAFEPLKLAGGGMLGGTPVDTPTAPTVTPSTGMLEGTTVDVTPLPFTMKADQETFEKAMAGDINAYADIMFSLSQTEDPTRYKSIIEQLGLYSAGLGGQGVDVNRPDKGYRAEFVEPAYRQATTAGAIATLKTDYNNAIEAGDYNKAREIKKALDAGPDVAYSYFGKQYPEYQQSGGMIETAMQQYFDNPFRVGAPGEYQQTFLDQWGDLAQDVAESKVVQSIVSKINPAAGIVFTNVTKVLSGDELNPAEILMTVGSLGELSSVEQSDLFKFLPEGSKEIADQLEDAYKTLYQESGLQEVYADVSAFGDFIDEFTQDLFVGDFASKKDLNEILALLEQASLNRGGGFTPQRGSQALLPKPRLSKPEGSSVMAVLNVPSSVKQRP